MAYSNEVFLEKLKKLDPTQQTIETVSHWALFHKSKYKQIVKVWYDELKNAPPSKKLPFLYLANDIMQKSRKYGVDFLNEFSLVLPDIMYIVYPQLDQMDKDRVRRLLDIWWERKLYSASFLNSLRTSIGLPAIAENGAVAPTLQYTPPVTSVPVTTNMTSSDQNGSSLVLTGIALQRLRPLVSHLNALGVATSSVEALKDKVALIRDDVYMGDVDELQSQGNLQQQLQQIEGDIQKLDMYIAALREESNKRALVISQLTDLVEAEETRMREIASTVRELVGKRERIVTAKDRISRKLNDGSVGETLSKRRKVDEDSYVPSGEPRSSDAIYTAIPEGQPDNTTTTNTTPQFLQSLLMSLQSTTQLQCPSK